MINISLISPSEAQKEIASKLRCIRLQKNITQQKLSDLSGVSIAVVRKFERTGAISLESFMKLVFVLGVMQEILDIFRAYEKRFLSLDEMVAHDKSKRKRAR